MIPNYLVLDIENNASKVYGRKAGCFAVDPVVAIGMKNKDSVHAEYVYPNPVKELHIDEDLLVGHNLSHDLLFLWHVDSLQDFFKRGGRVWDTQLCEYILTGQQHQYAALRDLAVNKYGCKERGKLMEKYWDEGTQTSEIPKELVLEDVKNDVLDTEQVFLQQYAECKKRGLLSLIELQMDSLLATTEMSYNGMKIDLDILHKNKLELQQKLETKKQELLDLIKPLWR